MNDVQYDIATLYAEHYARIVKYLRRLVGDLEAEDVAQEVFVKVGRSLADFRGESSLTTWIYRIATNCAMDHLRRPAEKARRHTIDSDDSSSDAGNAELTDAGPSADMHLIKKEMNECIRGLVNGLPDNYRSVLMLSDLEGFTNSEIAGLLGLTVNTVKIRLHRARVQLRRSMDHACHLYRDGRNELSCDRKPATLAFAKR